MASPTPKRDPKPPSRYPPRPPAGPPEVVDPRWLLKALALTILAACILAYAAVCLLVYQGSWQLIFFPSSKIDELPSTAFQTIHFDAAATGSPRLTAWWMPAGNPTPATPTLLFLHDRSGSLSATVPTLNLLHRANVNIFAIDYRGFGQSEPTHPSQARMTEDAAAAFDYLVDTRHIPSSTIVPYGQGVGAVLAAGLANTHANLPAFIIDNPDPDLFTRTYGTGKSRLLPMQLLVKDHFDINAALHSSTKPKLLFADTPFRLASPYVDANQTLFRSTPDPKMTVTFAHPGKDSEDAYVQTVSRFVDEYLPGPR